MLSAIIVLVIYLLIALSAINVMGWENLADSNGPLAAVIEKQIGTIGATALVFIALFATSKTILSNILGTSRLVYDVGRDSEKKWLKKFTTISGIGNAPNYVILVISIVAIGFGLIGNLQVVASISNIFIFIVFGMVNISLLNLRYKKRNEKNEKPPFYIRLNVKNIPIPTVIALFTILVLFGFNIYNLASGSM